MAKVLDSYNEVGVLRPLFNKMKRIGPNPRYWFYRMNWLLVNKFHYITRFPIHLDIETTNHCNLRCTMCPHSLDTYEMKKGYFDFTLYRNILGECREHGLRSLKLNIRGEPLLHRRLVDMVALAKEMGILEVMFNTNGLLLTPEKTRALVEAGLDYLIVSIDGATPETYNKIRQGGDFHRLKENLEYFLEYRRERRLAKPLLRLQFVEMEENAHEVPRYLAMWQDRVDVMTVNRYSNRGCGERQVYDLAPVDRANCPHPWRRLSINWRGEAHMCCGDWQDLCILGEVDKMSLYDIWHSAQFNHYRQKLLKRRLEEIPCCKDCFVLASYVWGKKAQAGQ